MGDHRIDFDLSVQVAFNVAGKLRAAFDTAEGGAAPYPSGD